MNFEEAYRKLRDGTASDEEAAFVAGELENVRRISAIIDAANISDPGIREAEERTVQRARREFNRKSLVRTLVTVLCCIAVLGAMVCGLLFIPATISASRQLELSREEAVDAARECLELQIGEDKAAGFYLDYVFRELRYEGSIFRAVYVYDLEFEDAFGNEYEIKVNGKSGYALISDVDFND